MTDPHLKKKEKSNKAMEGMYTRRNKRALVGFNSQSHSTRACSSGDGENPRESYNSAAANPRTFISSAFGYLPSQTRSFQASQALSYIIDYKKPQSLPPVLERLLSDMKNLQLFDFSSLLLNALYDPMVGTEDLLLAVNLLDSGAPLLSVQPARQQNRKINNNAR